MNNENVITEGTNENKIKRTKLVWDDYMDYLIEAIDESKFMKRAEIKPMSTPKAAYESHVTSRSIHSRMAANVAKRLADGLGLNGKYIYTAMLMHDAGHPFSAHEGEEIFNVLGQLHNCGFFHHNAKGVEVVRSENVLAKALVKIPNIESNPELKKKLEEEFDYFLDVIISHDGEASKKERKKDAEHYDSLEEAVATKLTKANSHNDYKFVAQTPEGRLAKMADVIAYLATDVLDGFRTGIINDFDDEYLELFGRMFIDKENTTREENIQYARKMLQEIRIKKVRELQSDIKDEYNKNILELAQDVIHTAEAEGINMNTTKEEDIERIEAILEEKIQGMRKDEDKLSEEDKQFLNADISKLRDFVEKMTSVHSDVVQEMVSRMQEYFIEDVLRESKDEEAHFSEKGEKLFDDIKQKNYKAIVQHTKWDYQVTKQPEAAKELVDSIAKSLITSGAIRDKFYDRSIRGKVSPEALEYMQVKGMSEKAYMEYRKKIGIKNVKNSTQTSTTRYTNRDPITRNKYKLFRDVYCYTQKEGENFAVKYSNVYEAIPTTVRKNVEQAFNEDVAVLETINLADRIIRMKERNIDERKKEEIRSLKEKKKKLETRTSTKALLRDVQLERIKATRDKIINDYGYETIEEAKKHSEEIIARMIEEERQNMEEKMALQLAIDYIGGMTDRAFNDIAIKTGYMTYSDVFDSERGNIPSESVNAILKKNEQEAAEEARALSENGEGR